MILLFFSFMLLGMCPFALSDGERPVGCPDVTAIHVNVSQMPNIVNNGLLNLLLITVNSENFYVDNELSNVYTANLQGIWYIHKYNGLSGENSLHTKCDHMQIKISNDSGSSGCIIYTFYPFLRPNDMQVLVGNWTAFSKAGTYRYGFYLPDFQRSFFSKILHFKDGNFVQIACSEKDPTEQHLILASRHRHIAKETLSVIIRFISSLGLNHLSVQDTDLNNCPNPFNETGIHLQQQCPNA